MAADADETMEHKPGWVVTLPLQGWAFAASTTQSILQSAQDAGLELPSSCRNGTCRTCLCRMRSGSVRFLVEWPGLSVDEKQEGWILPCVAAPTADVALDVPGAMMAPATVSVSAVRR